MRLGSFIIEHIEQILREWDAFAEKLGPVADAMTQRALRDHARPILEAIAADMAVVETAREQKEKSQGRAPHEAETAAGTHGTLRHVSGFSLLQLTSEYRALRATVLRLWLPRIADFNEAVSQDMVRFNETIDKALAESVLTYSEQGKRTRDTFLGILGHDLRTPLSTMTMAGHLLGKAPLSSDDLQKTGARIRRSAAVMTTMVNDLLEYARVELGGPLSIQGEWQDMSGTCEEAVNDARAAHPESSFSVELSGDLACNYDAPRLQQVFSNLLNNAAQYSPASELIRLQAHGDPDSVSVHVHNSGRTIPTESLQAIFDPLVQLGAGVEDASRPSTSIGLGLFIAREITVAHGGSIAARSSPDGLTTFSVRIPKSASAQEVARVAAGRAGELRDEP